MRKDDPTPPPTGRPDHCPPFILRDVPSGHITREVRRFAAETLRPAGLIISDTRYIRVDPDTVHVLVRIATSPF